MSGVALLVYATNQQYVLLYKPLSYLQCSSEVNDPQLHWVGTIPELLQTVGLLLPLSVTVMLVDLSAVIQHHLDLGVIMLHSVRV